MLLRLEACLGLVHQIFEFEFVGTVGSDFGSDCGEVELGKARLLRKFVEFVVHVTGLKVLEGEEDEHLGWRHRVGWGCTLSSKWALELRSMCMSI